MKLSQDALDAFKTHAVAGYPRECVGLIAGDSYYPCENSHETPQSDFRLSLSEQMRIQQYGQIQALLHTHIISGSTKYPREWPSGMDMGSWLSGDIPWGIAATDGEGITNLVWLDDGYIAPLKGRVFVHGVHDCYSLVRDWFRVERGITLPSYARDMEWWNDDQDLYRLNFQNAGFHVIKPQEATVGDCVLMKFRTDVIQHAGVIVGPNKLLHHSVSKLSGEDDLNRWAPFIADYVRYV